MNRGVSILIGEKIRNIRKSKNLTIVELSEQINVTSGYISQIERDLISPSLAVLKRMAEALEIPLSLLFMDENTESVVTISNNERTKIKFSNINVELEFLTPFERHSERSENLEAFFFKLPSKSWVSNNAIINESKEFIYILKGKAELHIGSKIYTVLKGDSICVPEKNGHLLYNPEEEEMEAICIVSPSTY
jgi:transcriptional regulator with XRE-family HTH domain